MSQSPKKQDDAGQVEIVIIDTGVPEDYQQIFTDSGTTIGHEVKKHISNLLRTLITEGKQPVHAVELTFARISTAEELTGQLATVIFESAGERPVGKLIGVPLTRTDTMGTSIVPIILELSLVCKKPYPNHDFLRRKGANLLMAGAPIVMPTPTEEDNPPRNVDPWWNKLTELDSHFERSHDGFVSTNEFKGNEWSEVPLEIRGNYVIFPGSRLLIIARRSRFTPRLTKRCYELCTALLKQGDLTSEEIVQLFRTSGISNVQDVITKLTEQGIISYTNGVAHLQMRNFEFFQVTKITENTVGGNLQSIGTPDSEHAGPTPEAVTAALAVLEQARKQVSELQALHDRRDALQAELAEVERQIAEATPGTERIRQLLEPTNNL